MNATTRLALVLVSSALPLCLVHAQEPPPPAGAPPRPTPGGRAFGPGSGAAPRRSGDSGRPGAAPQAFRGGMLEEMSERFRTRLQEEDPAAYERLMELRKTNPDAFREEMRELIASRMRTEAAPAGPVSAEEVRTVELARQFREATNPEEAARLKQELKGAIQAAFDKRLESQRAMLTEFQKRMAAIEEQIRARQANRDKICELRLDELTRDENLRW